MKTKITTLVIVFLSTMFTSEIIAQDNYGAYNTDDSGIALDGYSPVSYLDQQKAVKGNKEFKVTHQGISYYFVNSAEMKKFNANPNKYTPAYGGWCALGIGLGKHFRTDPNKFMIVDGKVHMFLNNIEVDAKNVWMNDEAKWKADAEKNWKKLHG